jgi:hypothetical protein
MYLSSWKTFAKCENISCPIENDIPHVKGYFQDAEYTPLNFFG